MCLWGAILLYVVTVDNMSGTKALKDKTPYEMYKGKKPDVKHLFVCGCAGYCLIDSVKRAHKLQRRSRPVMMLEFSLYTNGFRMLDLETEDMVVSCNVELDESKSAEAS